MVLRRRRKVSVLVHIRRAEGREFQIVGTAMLQLRTPNEVRTNALSASFYRSIRQTALHCRCAAVELPPAGRAGQRPNWP